MCEGICQMSGAEVVFHCVRLKQACRRRDNAKSMDHLMPRRLRMCSEICTFMNSIVCMSSGLNTPKLQTSKGVSNTLQFDTPSFL